MLGTCFGRFVFIRACRYLLGHSGYATHLVAWRGFPSRNYFWSLHPRVGAGRNVLERGYFASTFLSPHSPVMVLIWQ